MSTLNFFETRKNVGQIFALMTTVDFLNFAKTCLSQSVKNKNIRQNNPMQRFFLCNILQWLLVLVFGSILNN